MEPQNSSIFKLLTNAFLFTLVAQEVLGSNTKSDSKISDDLKQEFRKKFDPVLEEFSKHRALNHPFFEFLAEESKSGFNSAQYEIYRDNFFRRTELTIPSVARFIEKAALSGDSQAVVDTIRNLNDEGGYGDIQKMHSNLLTNSHNIHGIRVFDVDPVYSIADVVHSDNLVEEVENYRKAKQSAFEQSYPYIAGNTWAHELAADGMLDNFRKAFFEPYQGYYTEDEYRKVTEFYTAHKDDSNNCYVNCDVELEHERMARGAAERACKNSLENIAEVRRGGVDFLDAQAQLWDALLREIENAKVKGDKVKPKSDFRKSPSSFVKSFETENLSSTRRERG